MSDPVRDAAASASASGSARIRHRSFAHPPDQLRSRWDVTEQGVADFAGRRTQVEQTRPEGFEDLVRQVRARWPWLADEGDPTAPVISVHAGSASYMRLDGHWIVLRGGNPEAPYRTRSDPTWIIDTLRSAETTCDRGPAAWRETTCQQWTFMVPPEPRRKERAGPVRRPGRLAGEAFVDAAGRLRAVIWVSLWRGRPRLSRTRESVTTFWNSLELWDLGTPVRIELPDVTPGPEPALPIAILQIAYALRERKRAYERT